MPRGNGGIIGPANIPTQSSAKGVWSLSELTLAVRQSIWPLGNLGSDPYFEYTTLLLPGNGTNGAQNNTFLDGSTNNFTITRNGNTTQGTFSPFSQTGWGNYFDGSGDYLTAPNNAAFGFGASDFTIEAWIFPTAFSGFNSVFCVNVSGGLFFGAVNGTTSFGLRAAGVSDILTATSPSLNTWTHVAVTRSGVNVYLFYNGVQQATTTSSYSFAQSSIGIGSDGGNSSLFTGYISNLRVIKGQALYTIAFTPSTTSLTTTSQGATAGNVSLLTCQSNRFIDNSTNNFTITRNGDTSVVAFSPFNPTASWSAATYGGSGYFDGNGDYLTVPNNTPVQLGTGDFEIDAWVYVSSIAATVLIDGRSSATASSYTLGYNSSGFPYIYDGSNSYTGSSGITAGQWNYIVWTRSSGTLRIFVNGTSVYSASNSSSLTGAGTNLTICSIVSAGGQSLTGYLSDLRIVKGAGITTSTVPTSPLTTTVSSGTVGLLLNFTNAGIYDATSKNDLETVGDAQISNTTAKWGSTSIKFDGTGSPPDYLPVITPVSDFYAFGTGDFTFELWLYTTTVSPAYQAVWDARTADPSLGSHFVLNSGKPTWWLNGASRIQGASALSINTWYHIAVARSGTSTKMFVDGTQVGSTYTDSNTYISRTVPRIGASFDVTPANPFYGYIQDLRVTKGYARYTANFTPPTAAFPTL